MSSRSYHDDAASPFDPSPRSRLRAARNSDDPASSVACIAMTVFALLGPGFLFSGLSHLSGALCFLISFLHASITTAFARLLADAAARGPHVDARRTKGLSEFSSSLQTWEKVRPQLLRQSFRVSYWLFLSNTSLELTSSSIDLVAHADDRQPGSDLPSWQPLIFRGTQPALAPPRKGWQRTRLKLELEVMGEKGFVTIAAGELDWTSVTRSPPRPACAPASSHAWRVQLC